MEDLIGKRFGRLIVIGRHEKLSNSTTWLCKCDCGNIKAIREYSLKNGDTKSCGCLHLEIMRKKLTTHGQSNNRIYNIYRKIIRRCTKPRDAKYKNYGGRGIKVCDEWMESFDNFYEWAIHNGFDESLPAKQCTIDRIDVNGDYCPANCRWASLTEQANNKTTSHYLTYNGERLTIKGWSDKTGIDYRTIEKRIRQLGWDVERTLTTPKRKIKRRSKVQNTNISSTG